MNDDNFPVCTSSNCMASKGDKGITNCVYCGAELIQVNNFWYHHSQFYSDGTLISPEKPQDVVT